MLSKYVENKEIIKAPFNDVRIHWAKEAVDKLFTEGVINGYNDGTFRPDQFITRKEAVKIFNRLFKRITTEANFNTLENKSCLKTFIDVQPDRWSYLDIENAANDHYIVDKGENINNWLVVVDN